MSAMLGRVTEMRQAAKDAEDARALFDIAIASTELNEKLVRALLAVEREFQDVDYDAEDAVDAALTAAGLDTQEKRDAARRETR